jgi:tungstate transport system substrate-binding protein
MFIKFRRYESTCITVRKLKAWQKILIVAVVATMVVISGTIVYFEYFARRRLRISTTTSLFDTGLLDEVKKQYEATHSVDINIISAGTGIALQQASAGDADIVLVHAPSQEKTFLTNGYGVCRKIIAYNYFTIVGPSVDPAGITGENATEALKSILTYGRDNPDQQVWFSRGDNSGTFTKEQSLWTSAGYNQTVISTESWYATTGSGMAYTLNVANQKNAYTLSDIGTFLSLEVPGTIQLQAIVTGGKSLLNVYSVMAVNPGKVSNVSYNDAIEFIKWLVSDTGQQVIDNYGVAEYGQHLFHGAVQALKTNSPQPDVSWIQSYAYFDGTECPTQYRDDHPELYP